MPAGAKLQFRYTATYVATDLLEPIGKNKLVGTDVCLCFVDKDVATPVVVPIRSGKVLRTARQGDFCVLEFSLQGFAHVAKLADFNTNLRERGTDLATLNAGKLGGILCKRIDSEGLGLERNADTAKWQSICTTLASCEAFKTEPMFYRLEGVYKADAKKSIACKSGTLTLKSGKLYEVRLLHYSPTRIPFTSPTTNKNLNWLLADADEKVLTFIGTKALAVDSDYDTKTVRFRAATTTAPLDIRLSFSRKPVGAEKAEEAAWDFDLHARVRPAWVKLVLLGLLIGIPIAAQGVVLALSNEKMANREIVAGIVAVLGLLGGIFATIFGARKS